MYSIGQLARRTGVHIDTLRYYEKRELLVPAQRTEFGHRRYTDRELDRLQLILGAKEFGFTLSEIGHLLGVMDDPDATTADVRAVAQQKLKMVTDTILRLERFRAALESAVRRCLPGEELACCQILTSMTQVANRGGAA